MCQLFRPFFNRYGEGNNGSGAVDKGKVQILGSVLYIFFDPGRSTEG